MNNNKTSAEKFIENQCTPAQEVQRLNELYREYIVYSLENGFETDTMYGFTENMHRMGYFKTYRKPGRTPYIAGISLKNKSS